MQRKIIKILQNEEKYIDILRNAAYNKNMLRNEELKGVEK